MTTPATATHRNEDGQTSTSTAPATTTTTPASEVLKNQHYQEEQKDHRAGRESPDGATWRTRDLTPNVRRDGRIEHKAELRGEALGDPRRHKGQTGTVVTLRKERGGLSAYRP
jgi:hypothetical protein